MTKQWIDIGFQGADPATDFRGAGLLGLHALIQLVRFYPNEARELFKHSINQETFHFFCVTGINITGKLMESLKPNAVPVCLDFYLL